MSLKSADFFLKGTSKQFEFVFGKYQEALRAKAESKNSKPETILKLDKWFHNDLPKKIKSRGKDAYLTHEEIVQCMKWKLHMSIFRQKLKDLIQMNTPRVVRDLTKKSFRAISKRDDLESAINALSSLKGVGPAFASAVLAAFAPDRAPFMCEEVLLCMPDADEVDYTMKEYNNMVAEITKCIARLNSQGGSWTPHKVDMALYSYYVLREHKPDLLKEMPEDDGTVVAGIVEENEEKENHENGTNLSENGKDDTEGSESENGKEDTEGSEDGKDDTEGSENGKAETEFTENGKDETEGSENGKDETEGSENGKEDTEVTTNGTEDGRETPDQPETENGKKLEPEKEKSPSAKRPLECDEVENETQENEAKRAREENGTEDDQSSPHKTTNHVLLAC